MLNNKKLQKSILIILILGLSIRLGLLWGINWPIISTPFNADYLETKYNHSQWRVPNSSTPIDDELLYEYAGWAMVYNRVPIFMVNPEVPPLAKYIFGIVETATGMEKLSGAIFSTGSIILMVIIGWRLFKNWTWGLLAAFAYSFQPLFTINFFRSLLDIPVLFFLLLGIFCYSYKSGKMFVLGTLFLALLPSIKMSLFFFPLVGGLFLVEVWQRRDYRLLFWTPLLCIPLLLSYLPFFVDGGSLVQWLKNQKWILTFYRQGTLPSPIYNTLMMYSVGKWKTAFSPFAVISFPEWNLSWSLFGIVVVFFWRRIITNPIAFLLAAWSGIALLMFSFTYPWPRYFIVVLPLINILFFYVLREVLYKKYPILTKYV